MGEVGGGGGKKISIECPLGIHFKALSVVIF